MSSTTTATAGNIERAIASARQASKPVRDAYGTQKPFAAARGR
ncbi:hypothetical protein [Micromonospora orduensis]